MVDLSHEAAHRYWQEYPDPIIYRVLAFMEGVESFTIDGTEAFEVAMEKVGEALDQAGNYELGLKEEFLELATYIKAMRNLRLLQALDMAHPGAASKVIMHAEETTKGEDDMPGLFLRRNIIFERLRLLSRVFDKERLALISTALGGDDA